MSSIATNRGARAEAAIMVRLREDRDDGAICELVNEESFRHGASHFHPFPALDGFRAWLASLGDNRLEIVAEIEGQVIGFCGLYILPQRRNHCAWFFLGVRERFQGNGVGNSLLQTMIAASDVLFGLGRLELTVFADNERAIGLYRKFGFEIEGRHRNFVHRGHEKIDAYTMARVRPDARPPNSVEEFHARVAELARWLRLRRSAPGHG